MVTVGCAVSTKSLMRSARSGMFIDLQVTAEPGQTPIKMRLDSGHLRSRQLGNFTHCPAEAVHQYDRQPLLFRQLS